MTKRPTRALLAVLGALLVQYAATIPSYLTGLPAATLSTGLLAIGLLSLTTALTATTPTQHARVLAGGSLVVGSLAGLWIAATATGPTTDAFTFTQYAGELVLNGQNPYPVSMAPALDRYARDPLRPTYRVDGSRVTTFSYPAASILYGALGAAFTHVSSNAFYVLLVGLLSIAGGLIYVELPRDLTALAPISLLAAGNLWVSAAGGIIDAIWLLPLVATMGAWHRDRLALAGVCFGVAVAAKQQPWLIAPAAVIALYRTAPEADRVARPLSFALPAAVVFTAINAPFLIANPVAWLEGVFVAVDVTKPAIVQDGVGIVTLSTTGLLHISSGVLGAATIIAAMAAYAAVYWRPKELEHVIWLIPPVVLFWSPRSLTSYFTMFAPVAALAVGHYTRTHQTDA